MWVVCSVGFGFYLHLHHPHHKTTEHKDICAFWIESVCWSFGQKEQHAAGNFILIVILYASGIGPYSMHCALGRPYRTLLLVHLDGGFAMPVRTQILDSGSSGCVYLNVSIFLRWNWRAPGPYFYDVVFWLVGGRGSEGPSVLILLIVMIRFTVNMYYYYAESPTLYPENGKN